MNVGALMSDRVERNFGKLLETGLWALEDTYKVPGMDPQDRLSQKGIIFLNTGKDKNKLTFSLRLKKSGKFSIITKLQRRKFRK